MSVDPTAPTATETTEDRIWNWTQTLPEWQSDLLRRLCLRDELTEADIAEVGALLLADHDALAPTETAPAATPLARGHLPNPTPKARGPILARLSDVTQVGLLAAKQRLDFNHQLTVVYGPNGAGKSSYAKLLKNACRARTRAHLLANVFTSDSASDGAPGEATFELVHPDGNTSQRRRGHLEEPESILRSISVFDDHCAENYVRTEGPVDAFVPASLFILKRLAAAMAEVKAWCVERDAELRTQLPPFDKSTQQFLDNLATGADDPEVQLAAIAADPLASTRCADLDRALSSDPASPRTLLENEHRVGVIQRTANALLDLRMRATPALAERIARLREDLVAREKEALIMGEATERLHLAPGTGGPSWRRMWDAASTFHAEHTDGATLSTAERCPLCRTPVDDDARARFRHLAELAGQQAQQAVSNARRALDTELEKLDQLSHTPETALATLITDDALKQVTAWLAEVTAFGDAIRDGNPPPDLGPEPDVFTPRLQELEQQHALLVEANDPDKRSKLEAERNHLQTRVTIQQRIDDARLHITITKRLALSDKAKRATSSNALTKKQKELAREIISERLVNAFEVEREALGLTHLDVELMTATRKAGTLVGLTLVKAAPKTKLTDVMSTGERRALALAFFLAEVRVAEHGGGIILDDPVSSLDHERLDHVAGRLVDAASRRQVIIFTHDIRLMLRLEQLAKHAGVDQSTVIVSRCGNTAGILSGEKEWVTKSADKRITYLRKKLPLLRRFEETSDVERYEWNCTTFLVHLRRAWERAVEEWLLGGAVERFSPVVATRKLAKVRVTRELVEAVERGMDACTPHAHDQPVRFRDSYPTVDQLTQLVTDYEAFQKACQNAQKEHA